MFNWLIKLFNYVPVKKDCRFHKRMIVVLLKENAELKKKAAPLSQTEDSVNGKKSGKKNP